MVHEGEGMSPISKVPEVTASGRANGRQTAVCARVIFDVTVEELKDNLNPAFRWNIRIKIDFNATVRSVVSGL